MPSYQERMMFIITPNLIERMICFIRGKKIILDSDLALLYGIETKDKNQDVRFPKYFLHQLNEKDWEILKSQIVTSS